MGGNYFDIPGASAVARRKISKSGQHRRLTVRAFSRACVREREREGEREHEKERERELMVMAAAWKSIANGYGSRARAHSVRADKHRAKSEEREKRRCEKWKERSRDFSSLFSRYISLSSHSFYSTFLRSLSSSSPSSSWFPLFRGTWWLGICAREICFSFLRRYTRSVAMNPALARGDALPRWFCE